jgi:hypothetical protein
MKIIKIEINDRHVDFWITKDFDVYEIFESMHTNDGLNGSVSFIGL